MVKRRIPAEELQAWRTFLKAHSIVLAALKSELEVERNLSLGEYEVLLHLAESPEGRLRIQDLGSVVLLTQSGISRLIDRMQAAGLVAREPFPSDGRGIYVVLTPKGRRALREAAPIHLRGVDEHFLSRLTPREIDVLRRALGKVVVANQPGGTRQAEGRST